MAQSGSSSGSSMNGHHSSQRSLHSSRSSTSDEKIKKLQKLCYHLNGKVRDDPFKAMYDFSIGYLNEHSRHRKNKTVFSDEKQFVDQIRGYLSVNGGPDDSETFDNLLRQIKELDVTMDRPGILLFLYTMANIKPSQVNRSSDKPSLLTTIMPVKSISKLSSVTSSATSTGLSSLMSLPALNVNTNLGSALTSRRTDFQGIIPQNGTALSAPVVSESQLVRDLVYIFQGVNGQYIKLNTVKDEYNIVYEVSVTRYQRAMALRLAELGWLHSRVRRHCDTRSVGAVAQSLVSALKEQLVEYYRMIANLQSEVEQDNGHGLTLSDLIVWTNAPRECFVWLATIAEATEGLRGGAIVSCVYSYLQHGDPAEVSIVRHLLAATCKPIFRMLSRWMLEGELDDPHGEFFIAGNNNVSGDRLWHEKYQVQEVNVPCFISMVQAGKVLATGKSINFLREVCKDRHQLTCRDSLSDGLQAASVEALIMSDREAELTELMDSAYLETSRRVIDVLNDKYKFAQHLQALRDFLLLGQGDFIRYLMELLEPELEKPSSEVYSHNLSSILDSAIRATNAQYADADVLRRLDVRLLAPGAGDCGWDIFTLDYHTRGPIGTVFASTTKAYLLLFQSLWKVKRIEFILSRMWKQQFTASKLLRRIPEMHSVLTPMHLLTHEMVHTVHQLQYYVMFEVIECAWETLKHDIGEADSLDDIVHAHHQFVDRVKQGALIDAGSIELSHQMRSLFETVLQLKQQVDSLHKHANAELDLRALRRKEINDSCAVGGFGITDKRAREFQRKSDEFLNKFLPNARVSLKTLTFAYQNCVRKLIVMLSGSKHVNLQLLSFRLDFNEHYKATRDK